MGNPGTAGQNDGSADEKFVIAAILGSDELAIPLDLEKSYEESCHALGIA
ncbi:MAG TPA: hypothetical protein VNH11_03455 [Pirellulales bacterium]|nr:hypothetical protein [Pirellulales bacterium]